MMFEIFKISGPWLSIVGTKKFNGRVLVYDHAEPNEYTLPSSQGSYYLQKKMVKITMFPWDVHG